MKVVGILFCNSKEVLEHKQQDGKESEGKYCYWEMHRFPKLLVDREEQRVCIGKGVISESAKAPRTFWVYDENDILFPEDVEVRLYFAVYGWVRGYFVCRARGIRDDVDELRFFSESWTPIQMIPIKPSQGWRYFNHGS